MRSPHVESANPSNDCTLHGNQRLRCELAIHAWRSTSPQNVLRGGTASCSPPPAKHPQLRFANMGTTTDYLCDENMWHPMAIGPVDLSAVISCSSMQFVARSLSDWPSPWTSPRYRLPELASQARIETGTHSTSIWDDHSIAPFVEAGQVGGPRLLDDGHHKVRGWRSKGRRLVALGLK